MTTVVMQCNVKAAKQPLQSWANFTQSNRQPFLNPMIICRVQGHLILAPKF